MEVVFLGRRHGAAMSIIALWFIVSNTEQNELQTHLDSGGGHVRAVRRPSQWMEDLTGLGP